MPLQSLFDLADAAILLVPVAIGFAIVANFALHLRLVH
jgi:hypothetical protein